MKKQLESYYDTLWELLDEVAEFYSITVPLLSGGIQYGECSKIHIEGDKGLYTHIIITRMETGRYELVSYQL